MVYGIQTISNSTQHCCILNLIAINLTASSSYKHKASFHYAKHFIKLQQLSFSLVIIFFYQNYRVLTQNINAIDENQVILLRLLLTKPNFNEWVINQSEIDYAISRLQKMLTFLSFYFMIWQLSQFVKLMTHFV